MWRDFFSMEYSEENGVLYSRLFNGIGEPYYNIPLCTDTESGIQRILDYEKNAGADKTYFCTVPEEYLPVFSKYSSLRIIPEEPFFDYLYRAQDLINLSGRHYDGQRNQIHHFLREYGNDWSFTKINNTELPEIIAYLNEEFSSSNAMSASKSEEIHKTLEVLENPDKYDMLHGAVLRAHGKIAGFAMGEIKGDTLYTHIEKASRAYRGAYQMLVNLFTKEFASDGIIYVNREEDMGAPGLRAAKLAYRPVKLLKKYSVEVETA